MAKVNIMTPSEPPSFHWIRKIFARKTLRMSPRLSQLEGDLFDLRAETDEIHRKLRKVSGKVYRGVALGDTLEEAPAAPEESDVNNVMQQMSDSKQELYRRAAQLRRH